MRLKKYGLIIGITLAVSACGINGAREQTQENAQSATQINDFSKTLLKTNLGETQLILASGSINPSDSRYTPVGSLKYVITKTTPNLNNPKGSLQVDTQPSAESFPIYFVSSSKKEAKLIALVSDSAKAILLKKELERTVSKIGIDGITICAQYDVSLGYGSLHYDCDFETGNCFVKGSSMVSSALNLNNANATCLGEKRIFYASQVTLTQSTVVSHLRLSFDPDSEITPTSIELPF